ncbi:MAG: GNAT family N-acetyltransferase [Solirubrobacterales bacterium]|nr:MAG: GNAT family N-acetyltransferase [Solirubrobacterales bacterium]
MTAVGPRIQICFEDARVDSGHGALMVQAMRDEIAAMYDGLELDGHRMPRAGPADLSPPSGAFLVGRHRGKPVCCGGVKRLDASTCEIKRMYVVPELRGQGAARVLLNALEDRARELGYARARLDTGPKQKRARGLYESAGYVEIENFNENPVASFWGEKPLRSSWDPEEPLRSS